MYTLAAETRCDDDEHPESDLVWFETLERIGRPDYELATPVGPGGTWNVWYRRQVDLYRDALGVIYADAPDGIWRLDDQSQRVMRWLATVPAGTPLPDHPPI